MSKFDNETSVIGDPDDLVEFINNSGEIIPAFAIIQIAGVLTKRGRLVYYVVKPTDDGEGELSDRTFLINGPLAIEPGELGTASDGLKPILALVKTGDVIGRINTSYGVEADSWGLANDSTGFISVNNGVGFATNSTDLAFVKQLIGSGGGCVSQNAIQHITIIGSPTEGSFILIFRINNINYETTAIAYNANESTIQTVIEQLSPFEPGDIIVTGGANQTISVEFAGEYEETAIAPIRADWSNLGATDDYGVAAIISIIQEGR